MLTVSFLQFKKLVRILSLQCVLKECLVMIVEKSVSAKMEPVVIMLMAPVPALRGTWD